MIKPSAPLTILVIENDEAIQKMLSQSLSQAGYRVAVASNGREGFTRYIEQQPALVIMGECLQTIENLNPAVAMRNYQTDKAIPILLLVDADNHQAIEKGLHEGITDFITLPLQPDLLLQRLKYALHNATIEQSLLQQQSQLIYSQKLAKLAYWEWDAVNDEISGSASAFALLGIPKQPGIQLAPFFSHIKTKDLPLIQQAISDAHQGQPSIQASFRVIQHDGHFTHIECLGDAFYNENGQLIKITGTLQDISYLQKAESLTQFQSLHDSLTELPNRQAFTRTLASYIKESHHHKISAVLIFDIDRFKQINDNLGQQQGDNLLSSLALRLKRITRQGNYVARLGSDEFAILVKNLDNLKELHLLVARIQNDLNAPFVIANQELFVSYSIGLSVYPQDAKTDSTLLAHANVAKAEAKSLGGNQFSFYRAEMNTEAKELLLLENDLRRALKNREIEVMYQPQVDAKTLVPTGAEALVRWQHPQKGVISPEIFVPLAESTGMIIEIGLFVLQQAIQQTESWHQKGFDHLRIGINLSSRQFTQSNLMADIEKILRLTSLPAKFIDLEITESLAMSNAESTISILQGLKALGLGLSIDDFGTGYSSLAYLHSFPIDTIKIDRSFVLNLDTKEGRAIARTIIAMAESLNLEVIAEGIEHNEHMQFLQTQNCDIFQGYKFGKPMHPLDFLHWLQNYQPNPAEQIQ